MEMKVLVYHILSLHLYIFLLPGFGHSILRSCILEPFDVTILFSTENEMKKLELQHCIDRQQTE